MTEEYFASSASTLNTNGRMEERAKDAPSVQKWCPSTAKNITVNDIIHYNSEIVKNSSVNYHIVLWWAAERHVATLLPGRPPLWCDSGLLTELKLKQTLLKIYRVQ